MFKINFEYILVDFRANATKSASIHYKYIVILIEIFKV